MCSRGASASGVPSRSAAASIHWKRRLRLALAFFEAHFGIDLEKAGEIHGGEKQVAHFIFHASVGLRTWRWSPALVGSAARRVR